MKASASGFAGVGAFFVSCHQRRIERCVSFASQNGAYPGGCGKSILAD